MDKSNGYEKIAASFIKVRGQASNTIGTSSVRAWARTMPVGSTIADLGCGPGIPISRLLLDEGMTVYGIDASPAMVNAFRQNFPLSRVACEPVEDSSFFGRTFDGIIAWGLMFLLAKETQALLIQKAGKALQTGGKFLFTSPGNEAGWTDVMTGHYAESLGADSYRQLLSASGFALLNEYEDEGQNYYFDSIKR